MKLSKKNLISAVNEASLQLTNNQLTPDAHSRTLKNCIRYVHRFIYACINIFYLRFYRLIWDYNNVPISRTVHRFEPLTAPLSAIQNRTHPQHLFNECVTSGLIQYGHDEEYFYIYCVLDDLTVHWRTQWDLKQKRSQRKADAINRFFATGEYAGMVFLRIQYIHGNFLLITF